MQQDFEKTLEEIRFIKNQNFNNRRWRCNIINYLGEKNFNHNKIYITNRTQEKAIEIKKTKPRSKRQWN